MEAMVAVVDAGDGPVDISDQELPVSWSTFVFEVIFSFGSAVERFGGNGFGISGFSLTTGGRIRGFPSYNEAPVKAEMNILLKWI